MDSCKQCGLRAGLFDVQLNASRVCNYCEYWQLRAPEFGNQERLASLLQQRIEKLRGLGPYDALVGFSGGKDSTYVIHALTRRFGLRVLAITFDNGFLSDYARTNIATAVNRLNIDHLFFAPDWEIHRAYYEAAFRTFGDPCIACAMGIYFHSIKFAYEKRIPMVVHGRSPYQIFRNYYEGSPDIFLVLHESNYEPHSFKRLREIYGRFDGTARGWLDQMFPHDASMKSKVYNEFFLDPMNAELERLPDFIGLFQYVAYDEEAIKSSMEREVGYRRPAADQLLGHGDCRIHDASGYVFRQLHGVSAVEVEVAAMRRHGVLSKEEGEALMSKKDAQELVYPQTSVDDFCKKSGWSRQQFDEQIQSLRTRITRKFPCH